MVALSALSADQFAALTSTAISGLNATQLGFIAVRRPEDVTRRDCIGITYAGATMLVLFLAGTAVWTRAGLPMDF